MAEVLAGAVVEGVAKEGSGRLDGALEGQDGLNWMYGYCGPCTNWYRWAWVAENHYRGFLNPRRWRCFVSEPLACFLRSRISRITIIIIMLAWSITT